MEDPEAARLVREKSGTQWGYAGPPTLTQSARRTGTDTWVPLMG